MKFANKNLGIEALDIETIDGMLILTKTFRECKISPAVALKSMNFLSRTLGALPNGEKPLGKDFKIKKRKYTKRSDKWNLKK